MRTKKKVINLDIFDNRNKFITTNFPTQSLLSPKKYHKYKSKYKFPSLGKYEFSLPPQKKTTKIIKIPLLEEKKIPVSISQKSLFINKKDINKESYERIPPSFRLSPELSCLKKINEEKRLKNRLKRHFDLLKKEQHKKGGDTTEKFFNSISRNVLGHNNISVKDIGSTSFKSPKLLNYEINNRKDIEDIKTENNSFNLFKNKLLKEKIIIMKNKKIFDGRYSKNFKATHNRLYSLHINKTDRDFLTIEQVINKILTENKY